ncbi:M23 family metallopeptidase [Caulobacter sp. 17J80-11]|uniref:M23 family metallopeptidase n=1 Tax=Caulobacter sp. 17J80-11 TaxID=2763502 RepID=UPI001653B3D2|nr:M23 family metallopeptidase [Caulobacter sp. 17J80-11]MBC6981025.1 M23 family metallopeptidase [Caulobacter sp. 17J80-11]
MERAERKGLTRRGALASAAALGLAGPVRAADLPLSGRSVQGGFLFGRARPGAEVRLDDTVAQAAPSGLFVIGFDRDAAPSATLEVRGGADAFVRALAIERGAFPEQRIDGLPPQTVEPTDPAVLERIRRETEVKAAAFASIAPGDDFRDGFAWPLSEVRVTSAWGSQRILNGTPARPHYGLDMAAPVGAPIRAPAPGLVVLAEPDMHFEGGITAIDHGQGLISIYLHQSAQAVRAGDRVARGQLIGAVGKTGRATGPHLCWRMKWRGRNLDPSLMVGARAPA